MVLDLLKTLYKMGLSGAYNEDNIREKFDSSEHCLDLIFKFCYF